MDDYKPLEEKLWTVVRQDDLGNKYIMET